jgi:subtilisin family serine protease
MVVVLFVMGLAWAACAQVPPQDTGKMSWDLFTVVQAGQRTKAAGGEVQTATALFITQAPVTAGDLATLASLGYSVVGSFGRFVVVEAAADRYSDPEKGVNAIPFVTNATLPPTSITSEATPTTSGTTAIGAPQVWALGYRGQGTKIAVIDTGFDMSNATLSARGCAYVLVRPTGGAPQTYETVEDQVARVSAHGTACAIIAGDVAPDAKLYALSYPERTEPVGWLCALAYAVDELGVDVVSTSVEFGRPTCHADGTGPLNEEVTRLLAGSQSALVIAAGNWAQGSGTDRWSYSGTFADSEGDFLHDFTPASTDRWDRSTLRFTGQENALVQIILEWDGWASGSRKTDLDLFLYDAEYRVLLATSTTRHFDRSTDPVEQITGKLPYTGDYCLVVENAGARWHGQGVQTMSFHLNAYSPSTAFSTVEHTVPCGSVREVATNPSVIAVGAVSPENGEIRPYSSRGPAGAGQKEPDICAPDGVTGAVYEKFFGTSASAPYVAGAIALLRSADPALTPAKALGILQATAAQSVDPCGNPVLSVRIPAAVAKLKAK